MTIKKYTRKPIRFTGQHFLCDHSLINQLIEAAEIKNRDLVLDIGAGKGALTLPLSGKAARVLAIEQDARLACMLKELFSKKENVTILEGDFRKVPVPDEPFKVVSNIPYAITTDIFGRLMDSPSETFDGGVILMELGAARRFTKPVQSNPRIIGWNTWFDLSIVRSVCRKSFSPPPKVVSAMVKIDRRPNPAVHPDEACGYIAFLHFFLSLPQQRASPALRNLFTRNQVKRILTDAGIHPQKPVKAMTTSQWAHCFNIMKKLLPPEVHPTLPGKYRKLFFPAE
ncbi:MAG: 23S ribosomal RNA methyltransferase Erm [Balneolaceae bacterium]|nr:23S ribosomal RNA methyltransferase Erm [Balneolaceae bacterium]